VTEEIATEDQQQEEAADCELLPPKPAAADSQGSDFGSLLGKRSNSEQTNNSPKNWVELERQQPSSEDEHILFGTTNGKVASSEVLSKKRE